MQTNEKLGKYTLVRHIATGGMAEIWLGEQEGPGGFSKQLVIKRILSHLAKDQQFTSMFLDEARTVAQLAHPNIGQIFELGELDGTYFIAMEYIDGVDLSQLIYDATVNQNQIPIGIAVKMIATTLRALDYAHNFHDRTGAHLGLVHRDVTPHNILVSKDGVVKLVDFGVAKAKANQSKTQTGAVKGKFAYMAPEQIESREMDARVDVFAAGVVLYEILTGEKPFGDDLFAVNAILTKPMPDPREKRPDIPQTVVNILQLSLAKEKSERYQSAHAMMSDLEEFMSASGTYVNERDIANYVRRIKGLEPAATGRMEAAGGGPRAKITEREQALAPAVLPDAVEPSLINANTAPMANIPPAHESVPTAAVSVSGPQPQSTQPQSTAPQPQVTPQQTKKKKSNGPLVAVAGLIILCVVLASVVAVGMLVLKKEKADPSLLTHDKGTSVKIISTKPAKLYYKGKLVSPTPFKTVLKPGSYTVETHGETSAKRFTIKVKKMNKVQVFTAKM